MHKQTAAFPQRVRLKKPAEFERVFAVVEQKSSDNFFTILSRRNHEWNNENCPRLGLTIAKRRVRLAVNRNLIKRVARESFRHMQHDLPHIDCILMAKPAANNADKARLRKSLDKHWLRLAKRYSHEA